MLGVNIKLYNKITINPEIMCGKPVIKGARITVELILSKLSEGLNPAEIAADYPTISVEDLYVGRHMQQI